MCYTSSAGVGGGGGGRGGGASQQTIARQKYSLHGYLINKTPGSAWRHPELEQVGVPAGVGLGGGGGGGGVEHHAKGTVGGRLSGRT